jgi:hypothetical protein
MSDYDAVVYFAGPLTKWRKKVAEEEIIARKQSPYRFLARAFARGTHGSLDPKKCGYVLLQDGNILEHVEPVAE